MSVRRIDRDLGDCEIRTIDFSRSGQVRVEIVDPPDKTSFALVFQGVTHLMFETNHTQNVADSLHFYESVGAMKANPSAAAFVARSELAAVNDATPLNLAYIQPIAGGEMLIVFQSCEIAKGRKQQ